MESRYSEANAVCGTFTAHFDGVRNYPEVNIDTFIHSSEFPLAGYSFRVSVRLYDIITCRLKLMTTASDEVKYSLN